MNDQRIKEIKDFVREFMRKVMESGQEPPPEVKAVVEQVLRKAIAQVAELEKEGQAVQAEAQAPMPMGADLLWILAGGQQDAFVNYLRTYPDAGLNALLRNPTQLQSTIAQLERMLPQGEKGQQDGIPQAPIESSNIYGFQYDPKSGNLKVRFQSGSVYGYTGVPLGVFKVFQQGAIPAKTDGQNAYGKWWQGKIPSLGAAFYNLIKQGGYPYQKLQ